jgi:hypothetical protein
MEQRNLHQELKYLGLSENQAKRVLDWTKNLPIHISSGIGNTKISIEKGIIKVEPNMRTNSNLDYGN